jgi:DNA-binding MarR family transcriptional regulator
MDREANIAAAFATALIDRIAAGVEASELRPTAAATLTFIASHPECTIERLRRGLGISHSAGVRDVARLQRLGLVERRQGHGRSTALRLTEQGLGRVSTIQRSRLTAATEVLNTLATEERSALVALFERVLTSITPDRPTADATCRLCDYDLCASCPVDWGARTDAGAVRAPMTQNHRD